MLAPVLAPVMLFGTTVSSDVESTAHHMVKYSSTMQTKAQNMTS
jgi:hypothetical protein